MGSRVTVLGNIRVCFFSYYFYPHFSGAGFRVLSLAKELAKHGVQTFFITVDNSGLPIKDTVDGLDVYRISGGPRRHGEFVLWWNLWRALHQMKGNFDILQASASTYRNSGVGVVGKLLGKKSLTVVSMAHNDLGLIGHNAVGRLQARLLGYVDRYVSLSQQITDEMRQLPLDTGKVVEIPQGVDAGRFCGAEPEEKLALRRRLNLPEGPIALYVGVFDTRKNVKWLVKTWSKHRIFFRGWRLLLVGPNSRDRRDNGLRTALEELVHRDRLNDMILFRDFTRSIEEYYRTCNLFILPSKNEGMPNALLEAMASSLPSVVTRISGTTDLIKHGESGMLFEVNDERTFIAAMQSLVLDEAKRKQVGHCAAVRIREKYSLERVAERYLKLYRELLAEK